MVLLSFEKFTAALLSSLSLGPCDTGSVFCVQFQAWSKFEQTSVGSVFYVGELDAIGDGWPTQMGSCAKKNMRSCNRTIGNGHSAQSYK